MHSIESRTTATTATAAVASTAVTVLLQNMVGPEDVENDGSLLLLEEEIRQECQKFGRVERVQIVITKSDSVDIRVNFDGTDSAQSAVSQLNGRWFGGRQITATTIIQ
jgi:RNA-binding protein 39